MPLGLKATQLALIAGIYRLTGTDQQGPTLQALAARLAVQLSALGHALRPLVRDEMVKLRHDAQDRRTKHAVLTALGKARLSEAMVCWAAANDQVDAALGTEAAASLRGLADKVASDAFLAAYKAGEQTPDTLIGPGPETTGQDDSPHPGNSQVACKNGKNDLIHW